MRIRVSGSTGGIGSAFVKVASAAGHEIVADAPFDAFLYAVGTCPVKPLTRMTDDEFAEVLRVNCGLFVSQLREIVTQKQYAPTGLKVLAVSSVSATEGWAGGAAYCASKGALSAVCRALDAELKPLKISVKSVEPRYIKTRMFDQGAGRMGVPASAAQDPEDFARGLLADFS